MKDSADNCILPKSSESVNTAVKFVDYSDPEELKHVQSLLLKLIKELRRVCDELGIQFFAYGGTAIGAIRHHGFIPWDDDVDVGLLRTDYELLLKEAPKLLGDEYELVNYKTNPDYPANISILALKDTLMVPDTFKHCHYQYPIRIDIFAFDNRVVDDNLFRKQCRSSWLWGRLTFLRGTATPYISFNGLQEKAVLSLCGLAHGLLVLFHVPQSWICRKWEENATKYNDLPSDTFVDFTDRFPEKWEMSRDELLPLLEVPFEDATIFVPNKYDVVLTRGYGNYMELPPKEDRKNHHPAVLDFGQY